MQEFQIPWRFNYSSVPVYAGLKDCMKPSRKLHTDEEKLLSFLVGRSTALIQDNWKDELFVIPMNDDGMGSLYLSREFKNESKDRKFGRQVSECRFVDADGVEVIASLNVDSDGELFELDIWKTNYAPLLKIPNEFEGLL